MNYKKIILGLIFLTIFVGCVRLLEGIPDARNYPAIKGVPTPEDSPNDPKSTGLLFGNECKVTEGAQVFDSTTVKSDLPAFFSLKNDMPPVRSQGVEGSCAAWATGYYLKSYQEKIEHGYSYDSYDKVMSPAFVYNQAKDPQKDCSVGLCIEEAFYVLKYKGCNTWQDFPYNSANCSRLPTQEELVKAAKNKIDSYYAISSPIDLPNNITYDLIGIMKTKLNQKTPLVFGLALDTNFMNAMPRNEQNDYIYKEYDSTKKYGFHGMLIVGYDDALNAFQVVNSWGTTWGNKGYAYVSYDFFKPYDSPEHKDGLVTPVYFARDKIE